MIPWQFLPVVKANRGPVNYPLTDISINYVEEMTQIRKEVNKMADRYTLKYKDRYGSYTDSFDSLDEALISFLDQHMEGNKVQLTADEPKKDEEKDEWDF